MPDIVSAAMVIVVWGASAALVWKSLSINSSLAGMNIRATERERHDYLAMMERMIEKQTCPEAGERLVEKHGFERVARAKIDAGMEQTAIRVGKPMPMPPHPISFDTEMDQGDE